MAGYDFTAIEKKWQDYWESHNTFRVAGPGEAGFRAGAPKFYALDMFPYPSGAGLHVGHPEGYTATDIVARYRRMRGYNVLHPMGYDAFGLPAEQYAVEHGVHPRITTEQNIANIERQIRMFGFSYDWSRRLSTTDVEYYQWTQWIFLQLFNSWYDSHADAARPIAELVKALESEQYLIDMDGQLSYAGTAADIAPLLGGEIGMRKWYELEPDQQNRLLDEYRLAYIDEVPVNWCPALGTVLANEEVTNEGRSERGNYPVFRRPLRQWMLRITAYAERLARDVEDLDWPEPIKIMQRNWIGRSVGAEVDFVLVAEDLEIEEWFTDRREGGFPASAGDDVIRVYTTRPDTLFGATYMVLAPEHPLVEQVTTPAQRAAVAAYVEQAGRKSELERTTEAKTKTGVFTGGYAINPVTEKPIPIWVADYVMMGYGTGAIMAVPAHDTRDLQFAEQFGLPVIQVVQPPAGKDWRGFVDDGTAVNSGPYDGLPTPQFKLKITEELSEAGLSRPAVNYKLRDWLFSRQRYWGEPIPIVHCPRCGLVDVPADQLPLELPQMEDFTPSISDDPNAMPTPPLGKAADWVNTTCPRCGSPATRELNTMPQWAGSCWYYLRYLDPRNGQRFVDAAKERYWMEPADPPAAGQAPMGVDLYVGGAEHAVLHLLYTRFWHKVLFDLGHVSTSEPFGKLFNQGMIRSYAYRDSRGMCVGYEDLDVREDGPYHKKTGEKLTESIEKMSKSLKNVVNPDQVIAEYGADTFRLYEMFMGPLEASKPWNTRDVPGVYRFCQRVWRMVAGSEEQPPLLKEGTESEPLERLLHKTIRKVGQDVEALKFNTAIAAMMEWVNAAYREGSAGKSQVERFVLILAPFAPHLAEELWQLLGHEGSLAYEPFPSYDEAMVVDATIELPVQVNGKLRARISVPADASEADVLTAVMADPRVAGQLEGKTIVKKVVVPGRMVNLVVKG